MAMNTRSTNDAAVFWPSEQHSIHSAPVFHDGTKRTSRSPRQDFQDENDAVSPNTLHRKYHPSHQDSSATSAPHWNHRHTLADRRGISVEVSQLPSPSSLQSYKTPRKTLQGSIPLVHQSKSEPPHNRSNTENPRMIVDPMPFRDRFASAALVSKNQDDSQSKDHYGAQDNIVPNQLFISPIKEKTDVNASHSPNENSFVSFGNHSVFSDITDSEVSGSTVSRDVHRRKKVKEFKEPSLEVHREEADSGQYNHAKEDGGRGELNTSKGGESSSKGKKLTARLASFFGNRSISRSRDQSREDDGEGVYHEPNGLIGRSLSVPKERPVGKPASPVTSNRSGSPSMIVAWPGTLNANGRTVVESASPIRLRDEGLGRVGVGQSHKPVEYPIRSPASQTQPRKPSPNASHKHDRTKFFNAEPPRKFEQPQSSTPVVDPSKRSRVAKLKAQFESSEVVDLDVKSHKDSVVGNKPSDYHLVAAISKLNRKQSDSDGRVRQDVHKSIGVNRSFQMDAKESNFESVEQKELNQSFPGMSPRTLKSPHHFETTWDDHGSEEDKLSMIDTSASMRRVKSTGRDLSGMIHTSSPNYSMDSLSVRSPTNSVRLSEAALKQSERMSPKLQNFAHGANVKGYRGFIDKTADVPNLMDDESCTSASTMEAEQKKLNVSVESSDVFDGLSQAASSAAGSGFSFIHHGKVNQRPALKVKNRISPTLQRLRERQIQARLKGEGAASEPVNVVQVKNSLSSIQTTTDAFENRKTSLEFDATLTESDTDYNTDYAHNADKRRGGKSSEAIIPGHYDSIVPRKALPKISDDDSCSSEDSIVLDGPQDSTTSQDLSKYAVCSSQVRKLVKAYRHLSQLSYSQDPSDEEDAKKAFALFEMRSRIMETDIERGFSRTGGTIIVDDIVLTSFYKAACRVRDAVIVSKAWRDGASPQDARTAEILTKGSRYYVRRNDYHLLSPGSSISDSYRSTDSGSTQSQYQERVGWIDDTEFSLIRCFGTRTLRGSDIFTLSDCQSMLLKLTYEHCEDLIEQLEGVRSRKLVAESIMKEDRSRHTSSMSDAEFEYLTANEEEKTIKSALFRANNSFGMVKKQIESLVQKYEGILEEIDNENGSVVSYNSAAGSENGDDESDTSEVNQYERDRLTRRVQRAELKAEVASREAQLAKSEAEKTKQEAERIRMEKENELEKLKLKLEDLEAKSAVMASDFEAKLKSQALLNVTPIKKRVSFANDESFESANSTQSLLYAASTVGTDQDQSDAKERIKAKFRQRRTQLKVDHDGPSEVVKGSSNRQKLSGNVHQRLEFYERSLNSVRRSAS